MWLHEKTNITNNLLFQPIPNRQTLRRARFGDTSKYAVVYIYRPGKITNSLGEYFLYFDNEPMCVMKNKSGYMFKLFKEGDHEFTSRLRKDSSSATVKVQFGKSYYLKSMINWGFFKGRNFKLEMQAMTPAEGMMEFEDVNY